MLYEIVEVYFRLLGTNRFYVRAEDERFTAASSRCRRNLKYENPTSSFGRLRENFSPESVPHVHNGYYSLFNQSDHKGVYATTTTTQQERHKFAYLTVTIDLHALHVHFSFLDIPQTFSFFLRRGITYFAVVRTTWAQDDKCSILSSYLWNAGSSLIPG